MKKLLLLIISLSFFGLGFFVHAQNENTMKVIINVENKIKNTSLEAQKKVRARFKLQIAKLTGTGANKTVLQYALRTEIVKKILAINEKLKAREEEQAHKKTETITISASELGKVDPSLKDINTVQSLMLASVNKERIAAGLSGLKLNTLLSKAAQLHAIYLAEHPDDFAHTTKSGSTPAERITAQGYKFRAAGENIAAGQRSVAEVMNSWMNSQGHRENILNKDFQELGVGYYNGSRVQTFGTRQ